MDQAEAYKKQAETIAYYEKNDPDFVLRKSNWKESEMLEEIGATLIPKNKPLGFMRLWPSDFLVEEITDKNLVSSLTEIIRDNSNGQSGTTIFANLIKIGIPTEAAIASIATKLKISTDKIGFAGLKDAEAITSQIIAFPNTRLTIQDLSSLKIPQLFLNNFSFGKGTLDPGTLKKNIFTITLRTQSPIQREWIAEHLKKTSEGVLNYFHYQRFGGLRLLSHRLGQYICQGGYDQALEKFICESNRYDLPIISHLRSYARENYGDWSAIKNEFAAMPYTLFHELRALEFLIAHDGDVVGALSAISDQTQMWVYAYASWLFNRYLSDTANSDDGVEEKVPQLLSENYLDYRIYQKYLEQDETTDFILNLKPFRFITLKQRLVDSYIYPEIFDSQVVGRKAIINFALKKGAYATNYLSNIFELRQGYPVPDWVETDEVDSKNILGEGDLSAIKERFLDFWKGKTR